MRPPAIQAERSVDDLLVPGYRPASMRPPAIQAERLPPRARRAACERFNEAACNTGGTLRGGRLARRGRRRFNEAACNTGGTRRQAPKARQRTAGFNEAACNTGGTHPRARPGTDEHRLASMRPPAIQAEREQGARRPRRGHQASMRPPAIQAERALKPIEPPFAWYGFNEAACNTGGTQATT